MSWLHAFTCPCVSYRDQRVRNRPQTEEIQNLQKKCPLFCCGLPDRGGDADRCRRMGPHQIGQHLRWEQGEQEGIDPTEIMS